MVRSTSSRFALYVIGAIGPWGEFRLMLYEKTLSARCFIGFLERLLQDELRPIFLICDGHPVHRSRAVRKVVEGTAGRLELYLLPPYSSEHHPVEQVWNHATGRTAGCRGTGSAQAAGAVGAFDVCSGCLKTFEASSGIPGAGISWQMGTTF